MGSRLYTTYKDRAFLSPVTSKLGCSESGGITKKGIGKWVSNPIRARRLRSSLIYTYQIQYIAISHLPTEGGIGHKKLKGNEWFCTQFSLKGGVIPRIYNWGLDPLSLPAPTRMPNDLVTCKIKSLQNYFRGLLQHMDIFPTRLLSLK